jgi:serine/threonine protein kinase
MSPELLDPERFRLQKFQPTKNSDCYALGMVIYEVLSGQIPFAPSRAPTVMWKVLEGEHPGRPQGEGGKLFTDAIWRTLERCWEWQPRDRISAATILWGFEGNLLPWAESSLDADTDEQTGGDQRDAISSDFGAFPALNSTTLGFFTNDHDRFR